VFIDIDAKDFNMDMRAVYDAITERTKAIIPVHLFGQSADMEPLVGICKERGIAIVEDAAQAIGTEYQGKRSGTFGDIACFSFFPSKNLGAMGDGGLCTTQSDELSEALRVLRAHGSKPKYYHRVIGGNFRLDALQAAVLREKFKYLDQWTEARRRNAITYDQKILESQLAEFIQIPWRRPGDRHIFNQYNLRVTKRDELKNFLKAKDIESEIYYPVPMHLQECFSYLGYKAGSFPEAEKAANEVLAIPVYPELSQEQIDHVVNSMRLFYFN
jgi:dTDP-4-amino-4,6-dideoxygalactose transaminase